MMSATEWPVFKTPSSTFTVDDPSASSTTAPVPSLDSNRQQSRRWWFGMLLAVSLLGLGYWVAYWEWPVGPAEGQAFEGTALTSRGLPRRFRVGTFNIHGGYGLDERLDLERTAECLEGLDFVGLNEVRGLASATSQNQAEQLGELLNAQWLFAPTESGWSGPNFGQGAISRFPVTRWQIVPFPRVIGNGYRNFLECQIPFDPQIAGERSLTVLVTHLDRKADRQDQLRVIIRRFLELPPPVIFMGDLNAKRTEPQLIELAKQPGVTDCFGTFAKEPLVLRRIDWIFVRVLKCVDANLEATEASDHPYGWAELELSDSVQD